MVGSSRWACVAGRSVRPSSAHLERSKGLYGSMRTRRLSRMEVLKMAPKLNQEDNLTMTPAQRRKQTRARRRNPSAIRPGAATGGGLEIPSVWTPAIKQAYLLGFKAAADIAESHGVKLPAMQFAART